MNKRFKKEVETSCEYVLPDYMGDIKKILSARARCVPSGRFVSDGVLECVGVAEYEIIYADSENRLTAVNTSSDYSVKCQARDEGYVNSLAHDKIATLGVRVTGPRKISLRGVVESELTVTERSEVTVGGDAMSAEGGVQSSTRVVNIENYLYSTPLEREYAEEAERLVGLAGEDVEIIGTSGTVRITEVRAVDGGAEVKGEVVIVAIVRTPEQPPFRIMKVIPFAETVEIEGVSEDMQAVATGVVGSAVISAGEDGEDKLLVANAIVELSVCAAFNEAVSVVTDAYLVDAQTKNEYGELEYSTGAVSRNVELSAGTVISKESVGCVGMRNMLYADAEVRDVECTAVGSGVKISGNLQFSAIACEINADDSVGYIPIKQTVPFEENVNLNCRISHKSTLKCTPLAILCGVLLDGDSIHADFKIGAVVEVLDGSSVRVLASSVVCGELETRDCAVITVCYPAKDDTLFGIAKRYHRTVAELAERNSIDAAAAATDSVASLGGVKKLFIS